MKQSVKQTFRFTCAAERCDVANDEEYVHSVYAAMDSRTVFPRPCVPIGWNVIEGRAYCARHSVEVVATVRTPTTIQLTDGFGRRMFLGGDLEERVQLRAA